MNVVECAQSRPPDRWDSLHLLEGVREVAMLVDPVDIKTVAQRPFDRARNECPGLEGLPCARNISRRLALSWERVLELADLPDSRRAIELGQALGEREPAELTSGSLAYALRLIAARLGQETITASEYDAEREALMAEDRRHWRYGGQLWLPTANQVRGFAGTWNHALAHAGLTRGAKRGGQLSNGRTPTIVEVLDRCYEHHGVEATYTQLLTFARTNGVPMKARETGKPWADYIDEWKAIRRERGLSAPNGPAPRGQAPDFNQDVAAALPGERRRRHAPEFEDAVAWVLLYLRSLQRDERPDVRGYIHWAKRQDDAPRASEFHRHHGGWTRVLHAAWKHSRPK